MGSVVAKFRGANHPQVPPYVAFQKSRSHIGYAGYLGQQYDPFMGNQAAKLPIYDLVGKDTGKVSQSSMFQLPGDLNFERIGKRLGLLQELDQMRRVLDSSGSMEAMDAYHHMQVPLHETYLDDRGRPLFLVQENGRPIAELI